ncbi:Protein SUPPRESSOR OF PHYA-105 1 [Glycine soja]|uniref:Protein SUPPRESSOR OF PHYA-105 1 n=1 Tax=Glycine soja TaxID=3848 RepID=A0A0B2RP73_GLYSO|nr:Protein SUPPRESSOR OF PHYA-105 1 [Glycine soja]
MDKYPRRIQSSVGCLGSFFEGLCKFAHHNKFDECGRLRNRGLVSSANVMCVLSFYHDEDHIAAGGVSKKIKIFDLNAISRDSVDIQYPVFEISNKSKLSCVK